LFDQLLKQHGIAGARIRGYAQIEFTHAAVAAYVASDMADAAFGVEAAARQFDLDFIRLLTEDYVFVCVKPMLETAPVKRVLAVMRSAEFQTAVAALPGYAVKDAGVVKSVREVFRVHDTLGEPV
jgi:molybdate-binding protein